ncbi:unnamed protein product [Merluccius merluccius]
MWKDSRGEISTAAAAPGAGLGPGTRAQLLNRKSPPARDLAAWLAPDPVQIALELLGGYECSEFTVDMCGIAKGADMPSYAAPAVASASVVVEAVEVVVVEGRPEVLRCEGTSGNTPDTRSC